MKRKLVIFFLGMVFISSFGAAACNGQESKEEQPSREEEPQQETTVAQQPAEATVAQKETKVKVDGVPSYDNLPEEIKEKMPEEVREKIQGQEP